MYMHGMIGVGRRCFKWQSLDTSGSPGCCLTTAPTSKRSLRMAGRHYQSWRSAVTKAVARLLLEKGADVNVKDKDQRTVLSYAAEAGTRPSYSCYSTRVP